MTLKNPSDTSMYQGASIYTPSTSIHKIKYCYIEPLTTRTSQTRWSMNKGHWCFCMCSMWSYNHKTKTLSSSNELSSKNVVARNDVSIDENPYFIQNDSCLNRARIHLRAKLWSLNFRFHRSLCLKVIWLAGLGNHLSFVLSLIWLVVKIMLSKEYLLRFMHYSWKITVRIFITLNSW